MISFEEARKQVLARAPILGTERVRLLEGLGRVLANEITASRDVPHENNSAMDGYAVRHEDVIGASIECPARLRVIGESLAGRPYADRVGPGQAVRIMTGGLIPLGADTVVMTEASSTQGDAVELVEDPGPGANVRVKGQYLQYGEVLLNRGDLIGPSEVGILATLGMSEVDVHKRAVVAVLSTGDELVDLDQPLLPDKVYTKTGKTQVEKFTVVADIGKINNKLVVDGQIYGGVAQGIGLALSEDFEDLNKHTSLIACGLPFAKDIPDDFKVMYVENPRENGPFGAAGVGELPLTSPHVAVVNAIYNATGVRIRSLPALPEKVLAGLKAI